MRWPWSKQADEAERRRAAAEASRRDVERLAEKSREISAKFRREVRQNGYTKFLQQAWGGR